MQMSLIFLLFAGEVTSELALDKVMWQKQCCEVHPINLEKLLVELLVGKTPSIDRTELTGWPVRHTWSNPSLQLMTDSPSHGQGTHCMKTSE